MAESGKTDRWNSLLETLGVAPSTPQPEQSPESPEQPPASSGPPLLEQPRAISMLRPEKSKHAAKPKATNPPAKSASYWSRIAGALGLESQVPVEAPAEPVVEEQAPVAAREPSGFEGRAAAEREVPPQREPREDRPRRGARREQQGRGSERGRSERGGPRESFREERRPPVEEVPEREAPARPTRGSGFADGLVEDFEEVDAPRGREPSMPRERDLVDSGSVLDYETPTEEASDLSFGERSRRSAGNEDPGEEAEGRRRRRRRRGRGRRPGTEEPLAGDSTRHEEDIEPAGEDVDFDFESEDELEADIEPTSERELRGRERQAGRRDDGPGRFQDRGPRSRGEEGQRGSRGGRRSERERERGPSRPPSAYEPEPPRQEYGARTARPADVPKVRDEETDTDFDLGDEHDDEHGGNVPTHKKIPTWEEAVNILIDANMSTRGNAERERGRGRGRGRR